MEQLSEALRLLRVFHDVSQTVLADRLQISKSFLSEIESGKKEPTLNLLSRYAAEFEIPLSSLLFFTEQVSGNRNVSISEKIAPKVLKLLNWIAAKEAEPVVPKKPARGQSGVIKRKDRFGT
jgi:transcriptional regulator with XRE-family HTH domain